MKNNKVATTVLAGLLFSSIGVSACPVADLTGNCRVGPADLLVFCSQWLDPCGVADFDGVGGVNSADFALFAQDWRTGDRQVCVVINEFMADNDDFIQDPQGDYDDWLEIYNYGDAPIDIGGMYLADSLAAPPGEWWPIPNDVPAETTIDAGGFLLIWADGGDAGSGLHADFKLSASGEDIGLFDIDRMSLIDGITFGPQGGNDSYGRYPDGSANWRVFSAGIGALPTPGQSNQVHPPKVVINEIMYHPYHGEFEAEPNGQEFIELYNISGEVVDLTGWQFTDGIDFNFPADMNIAPGQYLVVAANVSAFGVVHPTVTNVIGGWSGRLSNGGEKIVLTDGAGVQVDEVRYADEGDWAERFLDPPDHNERGWDWSNAHDGEGSSLELINPLMPNEHGRNWTAGASTGGSPGAANSAASSDIAPLIVDIEHFPYIPTSSDTVTVSAVILDELSGGFTATLYYRVDGEPTFSTMLMLDDGAHGDGGAGDGVFGAELPAEPNGTIVEFYIETTDAGTNSRTCPAPADVDGTPEQVTNLLYIVDDSFEANWYGGRQPLYYIIMTDAEFLHLQDIGDTNFTEAIREYRTNAHMNATFISVDGLDMKLRYNVGVRNRGQGTRRMPPMNYRIDFRHDQSWKDITELNLNSEYTYLQQVGSQIFRLARLPAAESAAVQVRVNGRNLSIDGERMYHTYVRLEVINDDFAAEHFPGDGDGNVYKAAPLGYSANLEYLGTNPLDYNNAGYSKQSNEAENDWDDLFELTNIIQNEPDVTFVSEMQRVADTEQWLRWFAVHSLTDNNETNLGNGYGDDYYMYRGVSDPRFVLVAYDLDTILGMGDKPVTTDYSIFRAADGWYPRNTINRFLRHPVFAWRYYEIFDELINTVFEPKNIAALCLNSAGDYLPVETIAQIKNHVAARNAQVLAQLNGIVRQLTVNSDLPILNGYHRTTSNVTSVYGVANPLYTRSVLVNGQPAAWSDNDDNWSTGNTISLNPGINRVIVRTFDDLAGAGSELETEHIDIWYDDGNESTLAGTVAGPDTVLDAASGPWHVTADVTVGAGITLTIEPGTTLFFDAGCGITVNGRLVAEGTEYQRIHLTKTPGAGSNFDGIAFVNSLEDSRMAYLDMEYGDVQGQCILVNSSQLLIDNVTWAGVNSTILELLHPSLIVRNCALPSMTDVELVHVANLTGGEYLIFEQNTFGTTTGYKDIIDFSDCKKPGPILQVYNNTFLGGQDDGLDLDNADTYIAGNTFTSFAGGSATSTSSAIATDLNSEIVAVGNIFLNNDHAVLLKGYATIRAENNTFVNCSVAVINFQEDEIVDPGAGAELKANIFWLNNDIFQNDYGASPAITANYNIIAGEFHYLGTGNIDADPIFVDEQSDFHLKPDSPAIGAGPNGGDIGACVTEGANVTGEPDGTTYRTDATLTIGGPDIVAYKYRVKDNEIYTGFSGETDVNVPIELTALSNGHSYTVYVRGQNSLGDWPGEPNGNASKTWTVDTSYSRLRINELLAHTHGPTWDLVELYYDGPAPLNLQDMSMTDDPCLPRRFVFGSVTMNPGDYKVLFADTNAGDDHLGFALSSFGEGLYLYDTVANGAGLIDYVEFGQQINNYTLSRFRGDRWLLGVPTFGTANVRQSLGNSTKLKINEWLANGETLYQDDFVELYNPTPLPVSLGGLYLTDKFVSRPGKHRIADLSFIDPNGYAVFIADDDETIGPSHLNFKLSSEGEILGVFDGDLTEIDSVVFGPQTTDVSQGLSPDGSDYYGFFAAPTPWQANPNVPHPELPTPTFDSASQAGSTGEGSTLGFPHSIGLGGNRLLTVGLQAETTSAAVANLTVQSVKFNGVDLTRAGGELITSDTYSLGAELWYMLDAALPPAGTYTVQVTYSGSVRAVTCGAVSLTGVVQAAPEDVAGSTATDNPIASTVSASAGAWVIDSVGCGNDAGSFTTLSAGAVKRYQAKGSPGSPLYGCVGAGSTTAVSSAGPVTVQWSCTAVNRMAQVAASFAMLP